MGAEVSINEKSGEAVDRRPAGRAAVHPNGVRRVRGLPVVSSGSCSQSYGCESWVSDAGRRALPELVEDERPGADASVRLDIEAEERGPAAVVIAAVDGEASGPALVAYVDPPPAFEPAGLEGPQGCLPMVDAGPLFAAPDKRGRP